MNGFFNSRVTTTARANNCRPVLIARYSKTPRIRTEIFQVSLNRFLYNCSILFLFNRRQCLSLCTVEKRFLWEKHTRSL